MADLKKLFLKPRFYVIFFILLISVLLLFKIPIMHDAFMWVLSNLFYCALIAVRLGLSVFYIVLGGGLYLAAFSLVVGGTALFLSRFNINNGYVNGIILVVSGLLFICLYLHVMGDCLSDIWTNK